MAASPAPAWAHSRLLHTTPADGAAINEPTTQVVLTFNEMVKQRFTTVVVTGPDSVDYSQGPVRVVDTTVTQPVYPLRSGAYHVAWRAVSADGHPVQGEFRFTVALPPGTEPTATPPLPTLSASTHDTPWWPWLAGAATVLVVAAFFRVLAKRRAA